MRCDVKRFEWSQRLERRYISTVHLPFNNIHVFKIEMFPVPNENQIFRGGRMSMICDITTSLEVNSGPGQLMQGGAPNSFRGG